MLKGNQKVESEDRQGVGFILPGLSLTGCLCLLVYKDRCARRAPTVFGKCVSQSVICKQLMIHKIWGIGISMFKLYCKFHEY